MPDLTSMQAYILYSIVEEAREIGETGSGRLSVPDSDRISQILSERDIRPPSQRTIDRHLRTLRIDFEVFYTSDRRRFIDEDTLCTRPEQALYVLLVDARAHNDIDTRVSRLEIRDIFESFSARLAEDTEDVHRWAVGAGYIRDAGHDPDFVHLSQKAKDQRPYLGLLAAPYINSPIWGALDTPDPRPPDPPIE